MQSATVVVAQHRCAACGHTHAAFVLRGKKGALLAMLGMSLAVGVSLALKVLRASRRLEGS
jgi:hypothetical protein